ncbi:hypothetical protein BDD12DRAFT_729499 [Trichophaea hybrida]|nr:hypothetical protein BDD12DRAFT_729499 [Trichophaea hybrida]
MSEQQSLDEEVWNQYTKWSSDNGGFIHESLTFSPATSKTGASAFSTASISEGTTLLACPHTLVLDYDKATAAFPKAFVESVCPHAALCFFLCKERILGEKSFWWPYLRILPKEFNTPLYFDEADKKFLNGCNLGYDESVDGRRSTWDTEWSNGLDVLKSIGEDVNGYTWDLFLWATTVFTSRSFMGKLMRWDGNPDAHSYEDDDPALFPIVDSLNHRPRAKITWQPGSDALSLVSVDRIEAGDEIFNNYGPKANEELLLGYGFATPDNPTDTITLRLTAPLSPPQARIRSQQPQPIHPGIYHISRNANPFYPRELTTLFHILTATPSEIPLLEKFPNADIISIRNELATQFQLFIATSRKLAGFDVDPGKPQNDKQRAAKILRDGQIAILQSAIKYSEGEVKKIFEQHEGSEVLTIETTLTEIAFKGAVEKCFETSDVEELVEAEQEDVVFVLFLCWKYLYSDEPKWRKWFKAMAKHYPIPKADDEVDSGIQDVFDAVFPYAGKLAVDVFGGDRWTPALLGWAMEIYQSEGVNAVVDGTMVYMISLEVHE